MRRKFIFPKKQSSKLYSVDVKCSFDNSAENFSPKIPQKFAQKSGNWRK